MAGEGKGTGGPTPQMKRKREEVPLEEKYYGRDRWGASLIYFRVFIEAKPLGQHPGFRNNDASDMLLQGLETIASF